MWKFRKLTEGELERSPHEAEFFNVGEIDKATSIVREVIQNSLDARLLNSHPVRVKFTFGTDEKSDNDIYYKELIPHIQSTGLLPTGYSGTSKVRFLTIEDFGTTGLDGPTNREQIAAAGSGNYYNFWWCEGKSQKTGHRLGRWGLGKTSFHVASMLRTFWGFTVRHDDKRELLLGKALLKTHVLEGGWYDYYGYFSGPGYAPIENEAQIETFRSKFAVSRKNEPGFSLVIPFPSEEIDHDAIVRSVIIHYFFPIIKDMLIVEVASKSSLTILDSSTLREIAKKQSWSDSSWKDRSVDSLMEFLEDAVTMPDTERIKLLMPAGTPQLNEGLFGDKLDEARERYASNKLVALEVPLKIRPVGQPDKDSFFQVYLRRDEDLQKADEFYTREGITISEINNLRNRRVRGLLSAQDEAVCTFLGDCESPAHTDWKERTEGFKEKYHSAISTLRFIKSSMVSALRILDQPSPGLYKDLLQDIFFVPERIEVEDEDTQVKPPKPEIPARPRLFDINKVARGFRVVLAKKEIKFPLQAVVRVAYDTRRGNPFSRYHLLDFNLADNAMQVDIAGGVVLERIQNRIKTSIEKPDFSLNVTGFDQHRDIIVDVREAA